MPVTTTPDPDPPVHQMGDGEVVGARRARQGFRDRPILYVLLISLVLVVLAFGVAYLTNTRPVGPNPSLEGTQNPAVAGSFNAPEPAPKVPSPPN